MEKNLHGKVVLVTGGARRVGAAICRHLHERGATLMIHYRASATAAEDLAAEFTQVRPNSASTIAGDLLDTANLPSLIEQTVTQFGRLDVLINNASSFFATPVGEINETSWHDLIGSNLKAPLFLSQAAAPALNETSGCIINISDIHADRPLKNYVVYSIAKAGLTAMTRSLALELGPKVRVNAIAPGPILWPENNAHFDKSNQQRIISQTILERAGEPDEIALAAAFLISGATYTTGQVIAVDGGRSIKL